MLCAAWYDWCLSERPAESNSLLCNRGQAWLMLTLQRKTTSQPFQFAQINLWYLHFCCTVPQKPCQAKLSERETQRSEEKSMLFWSGSLFSMLDCVFGHLENTFIGHERRHVSLTSENITSVKSFFQALAVARIWVRTDRKQTYSIYKSVCAGSDSKCPLAGYRTLCQGCFLIPLPEFMPLKIAKGPSAKHFLM